LGSKNADDNADDNDGGKDSSDAVSVPDDMEKDEVVNTKES
jgi:hypothetical protein